MYRRRVPPHAVVTSELGRALTELSFEIKRQVGLIIDRRGAVVCVIIGTDREIVIPDLSAYRTGTQRLRGVRCVHSHLKNEPLTADDLTDLALLRLDLMAAVGVGPGGLPADLYMAHLLPPNPGGKTTEVLAPGSLHESRFDFAEFVASIEDELARAPSARDIRDPRERGILIGVTKGGRADSEESMDELVELARSSNVIVLDTVLQRLREFNPKYLMGSGKLKEVVMRALQLDADLLIFDQELTPGQGRAIADMTELKVIDRTQLILDIFARRAHSIDGKVQVELAQLKYRLPRLGARGSALSRLTGGIGGRGPGETKLEEDRARARARIAHLEHQLESLCKGRTVRRSRRRGANIPIVSIVGYTNAGKSTLLNALTESSVHTEDLLFATLDTSSRRLRFPSEREIIITDTVGFIRDLPPDLLGAFRATLDELSDANLLLHVVDISNPRFEQQMESVRTILGQLGLERIPKLVVLNKEDKVPSENVAGLRDRFDGVSISALDRTTFSDLLVEMERRLWATDQRVEAFVGVPAD